VRALEAIRRANRPGAPEDSIRLRAACLGAVVVAIWACAALGEVGTFTALGAVALISLGMVFSYFTRARPPGWIKVIIAVAAIAVSVWFVHAVTAPAAGITTVENPLTVLLVSVLVVHSFHVPARRDLLFSLGASAGLMAVGGAQAIDLTFGLYVAVWVCFGFWGLLEMWSSASGGGRVSAARLGTALAAVMTAAAAVFLLLPAPTVAAKISLLAKAGIGGSVGVPGALAGDSGSPSQLSRPGTRSDPSRVGGYLGFANSLDTALRGNLGNSVVMLVRAQRPSYWVGETFDTWNGEDWTNTHTATHTLRQQSPFYLPIPVGDAPFGQADLQTFYVVGSTANLVFHAESASQVWFPTSKVFYSDDGTVVSPIGLGRGAIYSVESVVSTASADDLRHASSGPALPPATKAAELQLPHPYARVHALAERITAGDTTNYGRVQSLIAWIGKHTRYSTNIPPLPAGADTVDEFLFGNRVGFCEQISTSLTVMLRTLGIPAREAVGYVPGSYNPITDLYQVRADDAHAWVQVWFRGFGWQNFDPTAVVPLANPTPGGAALRDVGHALKRIPPLPVALVLGSALLVGLLVRWRRIRPTTWTERIARSAERAGRRAGHPRHPNESLSEYAAILEELDGYGSAGWRDLASSVEASVYGNVEPPLETQRALVARARRIRTRRRRKDRRPVVVG
jgi:transglutaminase-like putative cysteine protease